MICSDFVRQFFLRIYLVFSCLSICKGIFFLFISPADKNDVTEGALAAQVSQLRIQYFLLVVLEARIGRELTTNSSATPI
jgi:hypothetical protein